MSNQSTSTIVIPSEQERRQLFYWLQKISSVTAWRRIYSLYEAWAVATENSLRIASDRGWSATTQLPDSEYALILKCLAHCDEGVLRLSKGDKRVFKFDAHGEFVMAQRMLSHWSQMMNRIEIGENRVNPHTPLWSQFCEALMALAYTWGECGPFVLESRFLEDAAPVVCGHELSAWWRSTPFPPTIEPTPDPVENIFVCTGTRTPYSGIWEPIKVEKATGSSLLSLFKKTPYPQAPYELNGAMNYLHGGSNAPPVTVATAIDLFNIDTTWRLLWRDDRYEDGTVPAIETTYQFTYPTAIPEAVPAVWTHENVLWLQSGDTVPMAGKWLAETDLDASVQLQRGDKLPLHDGREVRWVLALDDSPVR